jgi:hypothetical protein
VVATLRPFTGGPGTDRLVLDEKRDRLALSIVIVSGKLPVSKNGVTQDGQVKTSEEKSKRAASDEKE